MTEKESVSVQKINGRYMVVVPDSRRSPNQRSINGLLAEMELDREISRAQRIAIYRNNGGSEDLTDEQIIEEVESDSPPEWGDDPSLLERTVRSAARLNLIQLDGDGVPALPRQATYWMHEKPVRNGMDHNLIAEYIHLVEPTTEADRSYHLGSFLTAVGTCMARYSSFRIGAENIYMNLWTLLVGDSADRKSTAAKSAVRFTRLVSEWLSDRQIRTHDGIESFQGLLKLMARKEGSHPVLIYEDEIAALLHRMNSRFNQGMTGRLNTIYGCPEEVENNTKKGRMKIYSPFMSILGCGVTDQIPSLFSKYQASNGFLNRWAFFAGQRSTLKPIPPSLNEERWSALALETAKRIKKCEGEISITSQAQDLYARWYIQFSERKRSDAILRTDLLARKYAAIFAVLSESSVVDVPEIEAGIATSLYNAASVVRVTRGIGETPCRNTDQRILDAIKRDGRQEVPIRDIYRNLAVGAVEASTAAEALARIGVIGINRGRGNKIKSVFLLRQPDNPTN